MKNGKNFFTDQQGAVAIIVGVMFILVLVGILSLTVDLGRTQTSYNKNQGATDAAASAGAELWLKSISSRIGIDPNPFNIPAPSDLKNYVEQILKQNFTADQSNGAYDASSLEVTSPPPTGPDAEHKYRYSVTVKACANITTALSAAAGHTQNSATCDNTNSGSCTRTCTKSTAEFTLTVVQNLEVAFALDFTNSMFWQGDDFPGCDFDKVNSDPRCVAFTASKAHYLQDAMEQTLNNATYFPKDNSTVWASIVPYSSIVNLYPYNQDMINDGFSLTDTTDVLHSNDYDNGSYNFIMLGLDPTGPSYRYFTGGAYYTDFGMAEDYTDAGQKAKFGYYNRVLNRVPILDANSFNAIINDSKDYGTDKFLSYRTAFNSLATDPSVNHKIARNLCYNSVLNAVLDQRIEKDIGDPNHPNGVVPIYDMPAPPPKDNPACTKLSCYNGVADGTAMYGLYESFPIQPLTNNTAILKDVVNRFVATSPLFPSSTNGLPTPNVIFDRQTGPLTKSAGWSFSLGTSSIHGLLWAWFTINDHWQSRWDRPSVHENYFTADNGAQSQQSRAGLPSDKHKKHIIFMTDGNDNDKPGVVCDAYAPTGKFTTADYVRLCNKIKSENTIIHVLLLDFTSTPDTQNRFNDANGGCASTGQFYDNVQPSEIKGIMDKIFTSIITDAASVKLTK